MFQSDPGHWGDTKWTHKPIIRYLLFYTFLTLAWHRLRCRHTLSSLLSHYTRHTVYVLRTRTEEREIIGRLVHATQRTRQATNEWESERLEIGGLVFLRSVLWGNYTRIVEYVFVTPVVLFARVRGYRESVLNVSQRFTAQAPRNSFCLNPWLFDIYIYIYL